MTPQDYLVQQIPLKAQAEMAFRQGKYLLAAQRILDFFIQCDNVRNVFDDSDANPWRISYIGSSSATLMFRQILDILGKRVTYVPEYDNPYHFHSVLEDNNVPEWISSRAIHVAVMSVQRIDFLVKYFDVSVTDYIGLLTSIRIACETMLYFNKIDKDEADILFDSIKHGDKTADALRKSFPNDKEKMNEVSRYYIILYLFQLHYGYTVGAEEFQRRETISEEYLKKIGYFPGLKFPPKIFHLCMPTEIFQTPNYDGQIKPLNIDSVEAEILKRIILGEKF